MTVSFATNESTSASLHRSGIHDARTHERDEEIEGRFFPFSSRAPLCYYSVHDAFTIVFLNESSRKYSRRRRQSKRKGAGIGWIRTRGKGFKRAQLHCISLLLQSGITDVSYPLPRTLCPSSRKFETYPRHESFLTPPTSLEPTNRGR